MKKLLAFVLMLCLLSGCFAASVAESVNPMDLSVLNNTELLALLSAVQTEIAARKIEKTAHLTAGTYIGGRDIPVGTYVLTAAGTEDEHGIVSLRAASDPADDYPSKLYEHKLGDAVYSVFITIEEGDTLILPFAYTLTISGGVMFK